MRVAVTQFATSSNTQENLATCIRMINDVVACKPAVIVLPQFCNTQFCNTQPSYVDHNQAWDEALSTDGYFLRSIAEQAKKHDCYIVLNITLRQDDYRDVEKNNLGGVDRSPVKSNITVTSCLFSPSGELIHQVNKQTLTKQEALFFVNDSHDLGNANRTSAITTTPLGTLGLMAGNDDVTFNLSRNLMLSGAQLLCHSMSSFALDQSGIYGPARASENNVFLASANKIGLLTSQEQTECYSTQQSIPQEYLRAIGNSQIISPSGKVLAKLDHNEESYIFADIDLEHDIPKLRPDGTEIIKQLRPELYQGSTLLTKQPLSNTNEVNVPATVNTAIFATYTANEQAIEDVCHYIENNLSDIIQLPELFFVADKELTNNPDDLALISSLSQQLITKIRSALRPFQYVCTSLVIEGKHQAVIINEHGVFATQPQLHFCERYKWTPLGDDLTIVELPLEQGSINVAMLTADDATIPEMVKLAALRNIHVLLVPFDIQEPADVESSLVSRAAENRICIVAASREKSFADTTLENQSDTAKSNPYGKNKIKRQKSTGFIANLATPATLLAHKKSRKFNGFLNRPIVKHQHGKITKSLIFPIAACSKNMLNEL